MSNIQPHSIIGHLLNTCRRRISVKKVVLIVGIVVILLLGIHFRNYTLPEEVEVVEAAEEYHIHIPQVLNAAQFDPESCFVSQEGNASPKIGCFSDLGIVWKAELPTGYPVPDKYDFWKSDVGTFLVASHQGGVYALNIENGTFQQVLAQGNYSYMLFEVSGDLLLLNGTSGYGTRVKYGQLSLDGAVPKRLEVDRLIEIGGDPTVGAEYLRDIAGDYLVTATIKFISAFDYGKNEYCIFTGTIDDYHNGNQKQVHCWFGYIYIPGESPVLIPPNVGIDNEMALSEDGRYIIATVGLGDSQDNPRTCGAFDTQSMTLQQLSTGTCKEVAVGKTPSGYWGTVTINGQIKEWTPQTGLTVPIIGHCGQPSMLDGILYSAGSYKMNNQWGFKGCFVSFNLNGKGFTLEAYPNLLDAEPNAGKLQPLD